MPGRKKDESAPKRKRHFKTDQEMLEYIKKTIMEKIQAGNINLKVGDLLKVFEIQKKLSSDSKAEEKFWEVIEQLRQEELKDA